ncbi:hypothetical protein CFP56_032200 [Quercus suber]|uniref:Uncharacterized protein n=1 Tax=Quercus suber TaxID=58331 RepID=A0AAW0JHQ7_QUESU
METKGRVLHAKLTSEDQEQEETLQVCNPNFSTLHMPQPLRCLIFLLFLPMGRRLLCMFHPNFSPIKFHEAEVVLVVEEGEEEDNTVTMSIMMKLIWGGAELAMLECVEVDAPKILLYLLAAAQFCLWPTITFLFFILFSPTSSLNAVSGPTKRRHEVIVAHHGAVATDD